jgi:hypothetical protein
MPGGRGFISAIPNMARREPIPAERRMKVESIVKFKELKEREVRAMQLLKLLKETKGTLTKEECENIMLQIEPGTEAARRQKKFIKHVKGHQKNCNGFTTGIYTVFTAGFNP